MRKSDLEVHRVAGVADVVELVIVAGQDRVQQDAQDRGDGQAGQVDGQLAAQHDGQPAF